MLRRARWIFFLLCIGSSAAWAGYSIGYDQSGGDGLLGFSVNGSFDFAPGESPPYEVFLSYSHLKTTEGDPARYHYYALGLSHLVTDVLEGHTNVTYWNDSVNNIFYTGPSFGFTTFWRAHTDVKDWTAPPPRDVLAVSLNADVFIFGTEVPISSTTRVFFDNSSGQFVTEVIPGGLSDIHVTELHPTLAVDCLWWESLFKPFISAGHYFYSRDPARIEELIGSPRFEAGTGNIGRLVTGFLSDHGEFGVSIPLPVKFELSGYLGAARSQLFNDWATVQGAALRSTVLKHLQLKFEWNRAVQEGFSSDLLTGGVSYSY